MSPADRPAVPTVTSAPPGDLRPGWAEAVAGVLADPSRHRLAFQPVVDLQRATVAGYEALSRSAWPPDAGPWAALPDGLAATIRDRQTAQTFGDSVVGLTVDAPAVRACSASSSWCTGSWPAPLLSAGLPAG